MLAEEARRLGELIGQMRSDQIGPMLNLGSSTKEFRSVTQPWIETDLFSPIALRGIQVVHADMKSADGVDVVGNLSEEEFLAKLRSMKFRSVMCANLLEHVIQKEDICRAIEDIVCEKGFVIVTVPNKYPYHPDPIDTGFRPSPEQIAQLFPRCEIVHAEIIKCGTYLDGLRLKRRALLKMILRLLTPFYKPTSWWRQLCLASWLFRHYRVSCVLLKKM